MLDEKAQMEVPSSLVTVERLIACDGVAAARPVGTRSIARSAPPWRQGDAGKRGHFKIERSALGTELSNC